MGDIQSVLPVGRPGRVRATAAPYSSEFRECVVRVVLPREDGVSLAQIIKDSGIHETTIHKSFRQADIDGDHRFGATREESSGQWDLHRRNRQLEQESEV